MQIDDAPNRKEVRRLATRRANDEAFERRRAELEREIQRGREQQEMFREGERRHAAEMEANTRTGRAIILPGVR